MDGLASKIAKSFPLVEGIVIDRDGDTILSDIGNTTKIKKDMGAILYRKGKEIKHPVTGKSLGWDTVMLGEGRFEDIQEDFSRIILDGENEKEDIRAMDLMISK